MCSNCKVESYVWGPHPRSQPQSLILKPSRHLVDSSFAYSVVCVVSCLHLTHSALCSALLSVLYTTMNELGIDSPSYLLDLQRGSWRNDGSLPPNWEELIDAETGRQYYVDHNTETTSWVDPRDIFIKPLGFADCTGHEFAFGWESSTDAKIGEYFIDHNSWCTTLTDPRINGTISHLTKISDLQGHLDTDVPNTQATHHGLHAMTSAFRGMRDKGGQRRLSKVQTSEYPVVWSPSTWSLPVPTFVLINGLNPIHCFLRDVGNVDSVPIVLTLYKSVSTAIYSVPPAFLLNLCICTEVHGWTTISQYC